MNRLYGWLAAIGGGVLFLLGLLKYDRRNQETKRDLETQKANEDAEDRIDAAIVPNDNAGAAIERLSQRRPRAK